MNSKQESQKRHFAISLMSAFTAVLLWSSCSSVFTNQSASLSDKAELLKNQHLRGQAGQKKTHSHVEHRPGHYRSSAVELVLPAHFSAVHSYGLCIGLDAKRQCTFGECRGVLFSPKSIREFHRFVSHNLCASLLAPLDSVL